MLRFISNLPIRSFAYIVSVIALLLTPAMDSYAVSTEKVKDFRNTNEIFSYEESYVIPCTSVLPGSGAPTGLTYPNLDSQAMADAIEQFIQKRAPSSPMKGTASLAVPSAKEADINPFLIYAHSLHESSLGTTTVSGAQIKINEGKNTFGRTATSSQPNVREGGRAWYKWSSFQASVDHAAPENNQPGNSDFSKYLRQVYSAEIDQGWEAYISKYAPASDGNDVQNYIEQMKTYLDEMATSAGSTAGSAGSGGVCSSGAVSGSFEDVLLRYAHHTYRGDTFSQQMPDYTAAIQRARSEGRFIGGENGNDCGGFVTTLIHDSGIDTEYNSGGRPTRELYAWLESSQNTKWTLVGAASEINVTDLQTGDIGIYPGHTWVFVGDVSGFTSNTASASVGANRAPMASKEGLGLSWDSRTKWYRRAG